MQRSTLHSLTPLVSLVALLGLACDQGDQTAESLETLRDAEEHVPPELLAQLRLEPAPAIEDSSPDSDLLPSQQLERPETKIPEKPDGDYLLFDTPDGPVWFPYTVEGDEVLSGGDIILGTVDELLNPNAAYLMSSLGKRWPGGIIYYDFDANMGIPQRIAIEDALSQIEAATPMNFVPRNNGNRVRFKPWLGPGGKSEMGLIDDGQPQSLFLPQPPTGCYSDPNCDPDDYVITAATVAHEILHTAGIYHEQQRSDRGQHVVVNYSCIDDDFEGNYDVAWGQTKLGPYDLDSIMHYWGMTFCNTDGDGNCVANCTPMGYAYGPNQFEPVLPAALTCGVNGEADCYFSSLDLQGLYWLFGNFDYQYAQDYDYQGWANAVGDFDGDGQDDLASSAVLDGGGAGKVLILKGIFGYTAQTWFKEEPGLVPWTSLRQTAFGDDAAAWDMFGYSLAAGDFNDDGFDDLAVGAPSEDGSGAVDYYFGSKLGLSYGGRVTPTTGAGGLPYAGMNFGAAVTAADVDEDGRKELIVGAPADRNSANGPNCGAAYVYNLSPNGASFAQRITLSGGSCQSGAEFGASLTGGLPSNNGGEKLVVGAPGYANDAGRVYVWKKSGSSLAMEGSLTQATASSCVQGVFPNPNPIEAGDRFGESVSAGKRTYGEYVLAVGSPGEDNDNGRVDIFEREGCWMRTDGFKQSPIGMDEAGDRFGASVLIADFTGDGGGDLLVGTPGEAVGTTTSGWVYAYRGAQDDFVPMWGFGQSTGGYTNGMNEHFGHSLAVGNFDEHDPEIIVGAPGNELPGASFAGTAFLFRSDGTDRPDGWRMIHKEMQIADPSE